MLLPIPGYERNDKQSTGRRGGAGRGVGKEGDREKKLSKKIIKQFL